MLQVKRLQNAMNPLCVEHSVFESSIITIIMCQNSIEEILEWTKGIRSQTVEIIWISKMNEIKQTLMEPIRVQITLIIIIIGNHRIMADCEDDMNKCHRYVCTCPGFTLNIRMRRKKKGKKHTPNCLFI